MKIERIGDNIIRVTITYSDLEERNVDLNALNYNSPAAQEFSGTLWNRQKNNWASTLLILS